MPYQLEIEREYQRNYAIKHQKKLRKYKADWYTRNKKRLLKKAADNYSVKQASRVPKPLPSIEEQLKKQAVQRTRKREKDKRWSRNHREKLRMYHQDWYQKNKKQVLAKAKARHTDARQIQLQIETIFLLNKLTEINNVESDSNSSPWR